MTLTEFLVGIISVCAVVITFVFVAAALEMRRTARQVEELLARSNRVTREAERIVTRTSEVLAGALHPLFFNRFFGNGARSDGSRHRHGVRD